MRKNKLLLLLALLMTAATGAWAQGSVDGTIVWSVGNEASATVSASIKDAISSTGVTTGSGLTVVTATYLATDMVRYQPTTSKAGNVSGVMIEYRIEAVDGFKFKPTGVDYAAVKVGTDNISYSWSYTIDGVESAITDFTKDDVLRNNSNNSATAQLMHSESITADGCSVFTLRFYISNCDNSKSIAIGNITISGSVSAAASGYTVSLADGTENPTTWTASTDGTNFGALPIGGLKGDGKETVTLKYNGRLKVKSVTATSDAVPAKEPATVTTAPTGAAIVGRLNTNSTALVSGGVADGGTLMYAVTTTNTKPTSTAGFSGTVPTAKDITASGKVYVWYYVKGDDTHSDSEIAATAIEVPVADIVWDVTNVSELYADGYVSYEMEGVTMSANDENIYAEWADYGDPATAGIFFEAFGSGGYTFTAPSGKAFTKIEMKAIDIAGWLDAYLLEQLGTGWSFNNKTVTWKGTAAASTVGLLTDADQFSGEPIIYIVFYLSE